MTCEAHIIAFNEEEIIALTINHYKKFCDRIVIYDNHSTDQTREIAFSLGCDVRLYGTAGVLSDDDERNLKNECWKASQADWVIVCDSDEVLYHPDIKRVLSQAKGTIFKTYGWDCFSNWVPRETWDEQRVGFHNANYSKSVIFSPKLQGINYVYGCHVAKPAGDVRYCEEILTLFHYRNVGGVQRLIDRHAMYRPRMSERNRRLGLGCHYMYTDEQRIKEWEQHFANSKEYTQDGVC